MSSNSRKNTSETIERNIKVFLLFLILCAVFALYGFTLYSLQVVEGAQFRKISQRSSSRVNTIPAQRGYIYDRNANLPIVTNSDSFAVSVVPGEIPPGKYDTIASRLAQILKIPKRDIDRKIPIDIRRSFQNIEIKINVPFDVISNIAENSIDLPGVSWRSKPTRNYIETGSISHVVGYVGDISKEELVAMYNENYTSDSIVGKMGIEKQYDSLLQGIPGSESRTIDVRGRVISNELNVEPPQMGKSLVLSIDMRIQKLAEKALGERVGSAVVLRPSNGEILAMVSYPFYNQNAFNSDDASNYLARLLRAPNSPLLNRAVNAIYPPASTFKTIMTTAILSEKVVSPLKKINCPGKIVYGDRIFRCHNRGGHGYLNLDDALAQSCDVYYWVVGRDNLGIDRIANYAKEFGFGSSLKIDLPTQSEGFVPTAQWKERKFHVKWLGGDTMNMSIGQGYTLVTPLHVANMLAMVANGGKIYRPHILKEVRDPVTNEVVSETPIEVLHESNIDASVWKDVQRSLRYVITDGTPQWPMENKKVKIAGKTGTAEVGFVDRWHAWMAAYGPFDAPVEDQVVVVVIVEAVNDWDWWSPYATNIIFQGIYANQNYEDAVKSLPNVRAYAWELEHNKNRRARTD